MNIQEIERIGNEAQKRKDQEFKENKYDYLILANNDILIPRGAISELVDSFEQWPYSLIAPISTTRGVGHNAQFQSVELFYDGLAPSCDDPNFYQEIQDRILEIKDKITKENNLYLLDTTRMKMFNGFFFMMNKQICQYEREDGNLFRPEYVNIKNEDIFNWDNLLNNDDNAILCKTSFVFHFKGISFNKAGIKYSNNLKEHLEQRENNK